MSNPHQKKKELDFIGTTNTGGRNKDKIQKQRSRINKTSNLGGVDRDNSAKGDANNKKGS